MTHIISRRWIMAYYLTWFPCIFPKWSIFILLGLQRMRPPNWRRMSLSHFPHLYTFARLAKWPRAGSGLVSVKAKINLQYRRLWILSFLSWRPSTSELEKRFASLHRDKSQLGNNVSEKSDPLWHVILIYNAILFWLAVTTCWLETNSGYFIFPSSAWKPKFVSLLFFHINRSYPRDTD